MNTSTIVVIVLVAILVVCLCLLSLLFFRFRSRSRHAPRGAPHMSARWDHMDSASRRRKAEAGFTDDEPVQDDRPDEFGMGGGIVNSASRGSGASNARSMPGTGPNGTRTFLRGWFGLDEPTYAGYNTSSAQHEKDDNGDLLPMTGPRSTDHQPLPRQDDDEEWEVASNPDAGRPHEKP